MKAKSSPLFHEPDERQAAVARDACDAIVRFGWGIVFKPLNNFGERVEIKDPSNRGRLDEATKVLWRRARLWLEVLMERGYARRLWQRRDGSALIDSDSSRFLDQALKIFPGSRIYF